MKKCLSCGRENSDAARFCDSCGMRFSEEADVLYVEKISVKEQKTDKLSVVKSSIVLAVAVLITILSFMPTLTMELGSEYDGAVFNVYPSDNVFYLVDSFEKLENCDSKTLNDIENTLSSLEKEHNYYEKNGIVDYKKLQEVSAEIYRWQVRLEFKSEDFSLGKTLFAAALFSVTELLATVAFLIFAVLDFLSSIGIIKLKSEKSGKIEMCAFGFMLLTLAMMLPEMLASFYVFKDGSLHASKICSIVILSFTVFGLIVGKAVIKKSIAVNKIVLSGVSLALLAFVFGFSLKPAACVNVCVNEEEYKYELTVEADNIERPIYASDFEEFYVASDDEKCEAFNKMSHSEKTEFLKNYLNNYSVSLVEAGYADSAISQLLVYIMNSTSLNSAIAFILQVIPLIIIIAVAFVSVAIGIGQMSLFFDVRMFEVSLIIKILAVLLSVLAIIGVVCFACMFNYSIEYYMNGYFTTYSYKMNLDSGITAMSVCILAMAVIPLGKGKNKNTEL